MNCATWEFTAQDRFTAPSQRPITSFQPRAVEVLSPTQQAVHRQISSYFQAAMEAAKEAMDERCPIFRASVLLGLGDLAANLATLGMIAPDAHVTAARNLSFDWDDDPQNQLSIIIHADGRLSYAAYFRGDRVHGTANFEKRQFPEELLAAINKWKERAAAVS